MSQDNWQRITIRVPPDVTSFLAVITAKNASSQNSEIIRSVRERMDRQNAERPAASTAERS